MVLIKSMNYSGKYLFEKLPNMDITNKEELDQLLPWSNTLSEECRVPTKSK